MTSSAGPGSLFSRGARRATPPRPGRGPRGTTWGRIAPWALVGLLGGAGILHFVEPSGFDSTIPPQLPGDPRLYTYVSGVAELALAVGLANPRTRGRAGWAAAALFVAVFPANIAPALEGGYKAFPAPLNSQAAAIIRLPLQIPLIFWAIGIARRERRG